MTSPTSETYKTLNDAYDYFNGVFFDNELPQCLITMQRKGKARGYFCPQQFESRNAATFTCHEIAMNPAHFHDRSNEDILSTLLHEMIHLWQQECGNPAKNGYHDREWGAKMEELGLMPSNTGEEGGKKTGHSMSHYIVPGGKFDSVIGTFLEKHPAALYQDRPSISHKKKAKKNKIKYTCPDCGMNVWGKPGISVYCGEDNVQLVEA